MVLWTNRSSVEWRNCFLIWRLRWPQRLFFWRISMDRWATEKRQRSLGLNWVDTVRRRRPVDRGQCPIERSMWVYSTVSCFPLQTIQRASEHTTEVMEHGYQPDSTWVTRPLLGDETIESILCEHSERLALAWNFFVNPNTICIQITKNVRICGDCRKCQSPFLHRFFVSSSAQIDSQNWSHSSDTVKSLFVMPIGSITSARMDNALVTIIFRINQRQIPPYTKKSYCFSVVTHLT